MSPDSLKLTIYFGERDRVGRRFLADVVSEIYARHRLRTSLVMRGVEECGHKHHLRTDRLLTLSEDIPLVSVAVDARPRIEAALAEVTELRFDGLVTLERARMLADGIEPVGSPSGTHIDARARAREEVKLTVYVGRHERAGGGPAYEAVVDLLHRRGIAGATVLIGVDGTAHGIRRRARFFGANTQVPLMVIAIGDGRRMDDLLPELAGLLSRPLITLERVRVCKRDGVKLADPQLLPATDASRSGAAGATSLRGIWGFHGDHQPHGDSFWQLRRRVPIVTVIVDTPQRTAGWFALIDELTRETGLVTSEIVPALYVGSRAATSAGLSLSMREASIHWLPNGSPSRPPRSP